MAPMPRMAVRPRRFKSPHPAFARAKLEPIHEPLYSSLALAAAANPAEVTWFQYAIGGLVSGAGAGATAASLIHTNLETPSQLAMPKLHLITGVRVVVPTLNAVLTAGLDATAIDAAAAANTQFDDLRRLIYGTLFVLHVGTKDYLKVPTWLVPGNVGMSGVGHAQMGADNDNATASQTEADPTTLQAVQLWGQGKYFALNRFPILVPSQQNFFAALRTPQLGALTMAATRLVYVYLDGVAGREVQ